MPDCIFCKIQAEQLPAAIVHAFEQGIVIMDGYPLADGHVLVISRSHAERVNDLREAERDALFETGAAMERALRRADHSIIAVNWLINDGKGAYQHVPHVHLHLIPRRRRDTLKMPLRFMARPLSMRKPPDLSRLEGFAARLREVLGN